LFGLFFDPEDGGDVSQTIELFVTSAVRNSNHTQKNSRFFQIAAASLNYSNGENDLRICFIVTGK
jgi:hypothetical protein